MAKIKWNGGKCPVPPKTMVRMWFSGGDVEEDLACERIWEHNFTECGRNITDYEVIESPEEPKPIMASEKTLWDEYAMAAITGMLSDSNVVGNVDPIVGYVNKFANAMMKARSK